MKSQEFGRKAYYLATNQWTWINSRLPRGVLQRKKDFLCRAMNLMLTSFWRDFDGFAEFNVETRSHLHLWIRQGTLQMRKDQIEGNVDSTVWSTR